MQIREQNLTDPTAVGLQALAWTLSDSDRAQRMLALTGVTPDDLHLQADQPTFLAALLSFLEAHEPDLIACAAALGMDPETLVAARRVLDR